MGQNQFRIVSNGISLDTYDNLDFSFTYQIEDIEDVTTKKESYSKTILLPGTKINKEYFRQIQDVDIDISNTYYNPKKSLPVQVYIGDELIFNGNLQLLTVVENQKQVDFEVVITGVFKNIMIELSDYYISQLNLDEYNHARNVTTIGNSYNNLIYKNGILTQVEPGEGYTYPMIMNGNFQPSVSGINGIIINSYDLNPAIYLKTLMDKLFLFAGYTYTSKFFNSDYFKSLIMPLDMPQYTSEEYNQRIVRVGIRDNNFYTYPNSPIFPQPNRIYVENAAIALGLIGSQPISPALVKSNTIWSNNTSGKWWMPFDKESGSYNNINFQDANNQWSTNSAGQNICKYVNIEPGMYSITFKAAFQSLFVHMTNASFKYLSGKLGYYAYIYKKDAITGTNSIIAQTNNGAITEFTPSNTTSNLFSPYLDPLPLSMNLNATNVYLNAGDEIYIRVRFLYPTSVKWQSTSDNVIFQAILPYENTQVNYLEVKPATTFNYSISGILPLSTMLPQIKMRDLLLDVCKMFNLMVYDNPNIPNNLIIEPKDDFFNSKMKVKDWTYKLDYDNDIKQTPMSELDVKSYFFTYNKDNDYYNEQFNQITGKVYGEQRIDFINDFSTSEKKLQLSVSPTPISDNFIGSVGLIAPFFADISDINQLSPVKVNPRILFGKQLAGAAYSLRNYPGAPLTFFNRYMYCGMYDNPKNPTYTLEFGNSGILYYNTPLCCPTNTLINQFYLSTINELDDVNSKLLEGYFHLTPSDINDFDFRDVILINNSYWRVNRIEDYNPNAIDKTTKVILYKLNYIDVAYNDNMDISNSEVDCPNDIVAMQVQGGSYHYVSLSSQPLTEACCDILGGYWTNGICKVIPGTPNVPNSNGGIVSQTAPFKPVSEPQVKSGGIYQERPVQLLKNQSVNNSNTVLMIGENNFADYGSSNSIIVGNNNSIKDGVTNAIVIGDGIDNVPSNSIVVGDLLITTDGLKWLNPYITDGCKDEVMNVGKTNLIDVVDGSEDAVRSFGGDSKQRPIIDGTEI